MSLAPALHGDGALNRNVRNTRTTSEEIFCNDATIDNLTIGGSLSANLVLNDVDTGGTQTNDLNVNDSSANTALTNIYNRLYNLELGYELAQRTGKVSGVTRRAGSAHGETNSNERTICYGLESGEYLQYSLDREPLELDIVSTDSTDIDTTGTGARKCVVIGVIATTGINKTFTRDQEVVSMNGTTRVELTKSFFCIENIVVIDSGSSDSNNGTIFIGLRSDATWPASRPSLIYGIVMPDESVMATINVACTTGSTCYVDSFNISANQDSNSTEIVVTLQVDNWNDFFQSNTKIRGNVVQVMGSWGYYDNTGGEGPPPGSVFQFLTSCNSGTHDVSILFHMIDVED